MARKGHLRGFTLIEILVSIVIIGIVMSVAVLSLSIVGDDRDVRKEARRLMTLLDVAQTEAMMQGREFGVEFMTGSYRFMEFDPIINRWDEITLDDTLRTWRLPDDMEIDLILEDKRVTLDTEPAELKYDPKTGASANNYGPHLLLFSSGESTPFEVTVVRARDDVAIAIAGDLLGNLDFVTEEDSAR